MRRIDNSIDFTKSSVRMHQSRQTVKSLPFNLKGTHSKTKIEAEPLLLQLLQGIWWAHGRVMGPVSRPCSSFDNGLTLRFGFSALGSARTFPEPNDPNRPAQFNGMRAGQEKGAERQLQFPNVALSLAPKAATNENT